MDRLKKTLGRGFAIPWYPIAFGAYPVMALLAQNVGQVKAEAAWRPLGVSLAFAVVLFLVLRMFLGAWDRGAFLTGLWIALFFSYGHVHILLTKELEGVDVTPWLLGAWGVLAVLAVIWAVKRPPYAESLNVIALGLLLVLGWQISTDVEKGHAHRVAAQNAPIVENLSLPENPPDVYYIILDSYGRDDLLQEAYGYDNTDFLEGLRARGFYVAECSQSNYIRTEISMASSLNMMYLQDLDEAFSPNTTKRGKLWDSYKYSAVRYNFEAMGYKTVAYATGFDWNELDDADVFYTPPPFSAGMSEFETLFIETTLARHAQDFGWVDPDEIMGQNFRNRTSLVFDTLDDIARMPEPTYAYVHVISPHPPFVFGPNGEPTYPPDFWNENREYPAKLYARGYQNQLTFLNHKMLEALDVILAESDTPPVIIIQGDHGPWLQPRNKRMWILNAYHLPGHQEELFPKISPVNSFRVVFNEYFGGEYEMLPNISYFSPVPNLYEFSEIKNECDRGNAPPSGE
jgi:hypothetical protein